MTKCEYCAFDKDGYGKTWNDGFNQLNTRICKISSGYYIEFYDGSVSAKIHNCPKCGRELTDKQKKNQSMELKIYLPDFKDGYVALVKEGEKVKHKFLIATNRGWFSLVDASDLKLIYQTNSRGELMDYLDGLSFEKYSVFLKRYESDKD